MRKPHYYLALDIEPAEWREVSELQFIQAEQRAGFHSKFGMNAVATSGFSSSGVRGRVEYQEANPDV